MDEQGSTRHLVSSKGQIRGSILLDSWHLLERHPRKVMENHIDRSWSSQITFSYSPRRREGIRITFNIISHLSFLQNVEDYSNAPVVDFASVTFSSNDFRSNISWSSTCSCCKFALNKSCETKIGNFKYCSRISRTIKEIFRL